MLKSLRTLFFGALLLGALSGCTPAEDPNLPVHTKGSETSTVTLVEFSDFQCPYCAVHGTTTVPNILKDYGSQIRFEYRHYPLTRIHSNAELAGRAAEAAGMQGKFWEMHDMIFQKQTEWSSAGDAKGLFMSYAKTINLDEAQFKKDIDSSTAKAIITRDMAMGNKYGVQGTPTFYVNGKKFTPKDDYEKELRALLDITIMEETKK